MHGTCIEIKNTTEHWLVYTDGETEVLEKKPVILPLCAPQIPCGATRAQTWVAGVRGLLLITGATFEA
jgi:hypothetical protein